MNKRTIQRIKPKEVDKHIIVKEETVAPVVNQFVTEVIQPIHQSKEEKKHKKKLSDTIIIIIGALGVAIISAGLRITGIIALFHTTLEIAVTFVIALVLCEVAIARAMISKVGNWRQTLVKFSTLGVIQLALFILSFTIEYGSLSNQLQVYKNDVEFSTNKVDDIKSSITDYERNIIILQDNLKSVPDEKITLRQKNIKKIEELTKLKDDKKNELKELMKNSEMKLAVVQKSGMANTAELLGVDEGVLANRVAIGIAAILNFAYVTLLWVAFI